MNMIMWTLQRLSRWTLKDIVVALGFVLFFVCLVAALLYGYYDSNRELFEVSPTPAATIPVPTAVFLPGAVSVRR